MTSTKAEITCEHDVNVQWLEMLVARVKWKLVPRQAMVEC